MRSDARKFGRLFGDLKVRPKLIVLHNLFFLLLSCSAYFTLIPLVQEHVAGARVREISLVTQMFLEDRPLMRLPGMERYGFQEGDPKALLMPDTVREWLDAHPGAVWQDQSDTSLLYRKNQRNGEYRVLRLPHRYYEGVVERARITLFVVLGVIYVLAVLVLEILVMPLYVYRPLRLMLDADQATRRGDRNQELIDEHLILGDEIGQIMRSRNATVQELRKQEDDLAEALARLEEVAQDLQRKNYLLEFARKSLADQDRLASLGLLNASVAHELNTPLCVLQGSIEKLMETVDDRYAQERLGRMLRVTERLRKISEGLVDFSRVRTQELEAVEIRPVIQEAWELVAIDEKAGQVQFRNEAQAGHFVRGNSDRLVQVFVNLLRNALNAIKLSGSILVQSRLAVCEGREQIAITVEDDGPGIPPEVLPDIFEAFVTTRLDASGTGLGLAVAAGIVQHHEGTIEATNRPAGGACVEVRLPAASESTRRQQVTG